MAATWGRRANCIIVNSSRASPITPSSCGISARRTPTRTSNARPSRSTSARRTPTTIRRSFTPSRIRWTRSIRTCLATRYLEGPSFQFGKASRTHKETVKFLRLARQAARPWYACQDEIGPANDCVPPDVQDSERTEIIRHALWGNLMAGGSGVEWIFAYDTWPRQPGPHLDIACENWRPWEKLWDHTAIALDFFHRHLPFTQMDTADKLVNTTNAWCFAKPGEVYAVFVFGGAEVKLQLPAWLVHHPLVRHQARRGIDTRCAASRSGELELGCPPRDEEKDWVMVARRK